MARDLARTFNSFIIENATRIHVIERMLNHASGRVSGSAHSIIITHTNATCTSFSVLVRTAYSNWPKPDTVEIPRGNVATLRITMLFNHGDIVMTILSKRQLMELALYSPQHIARLEKVGQVPKGDGLASTEWAGLKMRC